MHMARTDSLDDFVDPAAQAESCSEFQELRESLVDRVLCVLAFLTPLGLLVSLARVSYQGWRPVYVSHIAVCALVVGVALMRRRMSYLSRVLVLLGSVFFMAAMALFSFGLTSSAGTFLIVVAALAMAFTGHRAGMVAAGAGVVLMAIMGAMICSGAIILPQDLDSYAVSWSTWTANIAAFAVSIATLVVVIGATLRKMESSLALLREDHAELKIVNERLAQEIEDRRLTEKELQDKKQFTDAVIDCLPGTFYVFTEEGQIVRWNKGLETHFGYTADEIRERTPEDWFDEAEVELIRASVRDCFETGELFVEASAITKDGRKIPYVYHARRLDQGGKAYMMGIGLNAADLARAKEAAEESESNYREIFNATSEAIFVQDIATGAILDVNQSMLDMYGVSRQQALSATIETLSAEDPEAVRRKLQQRLQQAVEEGPQLFEWHAKRIDGSTFWVEVTLRSTHIGGEGCALAVVRDISERMRVEAALRASERMYRTLVEISPDAVIQTDMSRRIIYASPQAAKLHGFASSAEMLGMLGRNLIAPEDLEESAACVEAVIRGNEPVTAELQLLRKDGSQFAGQIAYAVIRNEQGQATGMMGVCRNIERQKQVEEGLRLMARIVEETCEGIVLVDLNGDVVQINEAFAAMHGYSPAELFGKNLSIFHTPEQMPAVAEANRQNLEQGCFDGEVWHARRDGTPFPTLMHNTVLRDEKGEPQYLIGTCVDISERRQLEEATKTQRDLAVALNSVQTVEAGLELCLEAAIEVSGMESGAVYLVDGASGQVDLAVHSGLTPEFAAIVESFPSDSPQADIIRRGDPIYGCGDSTGVYEVAMTADPDLQSIAIVPIHHQGKPIACLNLASRTSNEVPASLRIAVESIASQFAGAIARLSAERDLKQRQALVDAMLDNIPGVVYVKDIKGRYQLVSRVLAAAAHKPSHEIIGTTDYDMQPREIADAFRENDRKVLQEAIPLQVEEEAIVDGETRYYLSHKFALHDSEGTPTATGGISVDITDRKRAEKSLQESEERYRSFVANSLQGIWFYRIEPPVPTDIPVEEQVEWVLEHIFLEECNDVYARECGFSSASEIVGLRYVEILGGNEDSAREVIRTLIDGGYSFATTELVETLRSGEQLWSLNTAVSSFEDGRVTQISGIDIDITDRKTAEHALEQSEAMYRSLMDDVLDSSDVGIFILDADFKVVWVNQALERYFGLKREGVIRKDKRQLILQNIKDRFDDPRAFADKVLATYDDNTYTENFECHILAGDGREDRWLEHWSQPIESGLLAGGRIEHYYDITDRKRAEERLSESLQRLERSEAHLKNAQRVGHVGSWHWNIETNDLHWSDEVYRIFGIEPDGFGASYEAFLDAVHPDDRSYVELQVNVTLDDAREYDIDHRIVRPDGEVRYVNEQAEVTRNDRGKAIAMVGTVADISARKHAEQEVERLKRFNERIVETVPIGIHVIDRNCTIESWNSFLEDYTGVARNDALGRSLFEVLPVIREMGWDAMFERVLETGEPFAQDDHEMVRSSGQVISQAVKLLPLRENGCVTGVCTMIFDTTEAKQASEQLRQLHTELAHVSRVTALGEMAAGLAHEVNQPLTCVSAYAQTCSELIEAGKTSLEQLREPLDEMSSEIARAAAIIKRLRAFAHKRQRHRSSGDINALVQEVVTLAAHETRQRGVVVRVVPGSGMPIVQMDSIQIQQVLLNLILNAVHAMTEDDTSDREVMIQTELAPNDQIRVAVHDTGPGIPAEVADRIFDAFFTTKPDGMGMGLSVSRSIVEDHGGRLRATPNGDGGSTFQFTLPIDSGDELNNV
jgi:PAS domain S-box-containing protein